MRHDGNLATVVVETDVVVEVEVWVVVEVVV
jgi:hypothetical protein